MMTRTMSKMLGTNDFFLSSESTVFTTELSEAGRDGGECGALALPSRSIERKELMPLMAYSSAM